MKRRLWLFGAICIGIILLAIPPALGTQYFGSFIGYHVGSYPYGIASADFNGDTYMDLVTANYAAGTISVLLGEGDGSFATRIHYDTEASQYPYFVDTGDLNGDGTIDIVSGGSMGFVIFYGVGDGTFGTANVHYFGYWVGDVIVADFNNDTYLDIATAHAVMDSVGIHINDHDSTFSTHMLATGYGTVSLATGYLDSDNYIDILVGCSQGTVWNLKNDQGGGFIPTEVHIGVLNDPAFVSVTDINGDNIGDFGVTHAVNDFLFTFFNDGEGTYTVDRAYVLSDYPTGFAFADVNHDGEEDILVCIETTEEIQLYLNEGGGEFALDTAYTVGGTPKGLVFADFNGDSYIDMAAASYTTDMAAVLLNRLSIILDVDDITGDGILPTEFALAQNYPNPFNPETRISFSLPAASHVRIDVLNLQGQSVITLVDEYLTAGTKEVSWTGVNSAGERVSSGVYFYRIVTDRFADTRKMVLIK